MLVTPNEHIPVTTDVIIDFVLSLYPFTTIEKIRSKDRHKDLLAIRHLLVILIHHFSMDGPSLANTGKYVNRDHCSVLHVLNKESNLQSVYKSEFAKFNSIVDKLRQYIWEKQALDPDFNQKQEIRRMEKNKARKFL